MHDNFGMVAKREVDAQRASKPRESNARKHRDNSAETPNKEKASAGTQAPAEAIVARPEEQADGEGR